MVPDSPSRAAATLPRKDMDMTIFMNPLKFLFGAAPDADVVLNSEDCESITLFEHYTASLSSHSF